MAHFLDALGGAMVDPACPIDWQHPLNNGLVADYTIVPNPGWRGGLTLRDLVRGGHKPNDGTLTSGPTWGTNCVNFDGVDDYVQLTSPVSIVPSTAWTLTWWGNLTATGTYHGVARPNPGHSHGVAQNTSTNAILFETDDSNNQAISANPAGKHVWSLAFTATKANYYKDGTSVGSTTYTATALSWNANARLGYSDLGTYAGSLYTWLLYNRTMSASSIAALHTEIRRGNPERFRWLGRRSYSYPTSGSGSFTANGTIASGSSSMSAAATFRAGIHTAIGSLTENHPTVAASATFSGGIHTATSNLTIGSETIAGSAVFSPGTHSTNAALTIGSETITGSSTFSPGVHTGVGTLTCGQETIAGNSTFSAGTHTANGSLTNGADSIAGTATFSAGTHTANGSFLVGSATIAASANFAPGTHSTNATLNSGQDTIVGSAEFAAFVGSTSGSISTGSGTIAGMATFHPPFTVIGSLVSGVDGLAGSATFSGGTHTAIVSLIVSPSLIQSFVIGPSVLLPPDDSGEIYYSDNYLIARVFSHPDSEIGRVYQ